MRVNVQHGIGDLSRDMVGVAKKAATRMPRIVKRNVNEGTKLAQGFARAASGPHGSAYWKRITGEMTGALEGEYGPHDGGVPVGGGWRHATPNTELERSQDIIGPKFAKDAGDMLDGLFW